MADQCEHNSKARLLGVCAKCKEKKAYLVFRFCKDKCCLPECKECGYFWGPDNEKLNGQRAIFTPDTPVVSKSSGLESELYTAQYVRNSLQPKYQEYFAKLAVGQSPRWKCDQRTSDLFCLSQWLMDELKLFGGPDLDKLDTQNYFNRKARSEEDLFELAARAINKFLDGSIERYRRFKRKP